MLRIRLKQPLLPVLTVLLIGLQLLEPSRIWLILIVPFLGLLAGSFIWTSILSRNLQLRRESRLGWIEAGGQIEERLTLTNPTNLSAPIVEVEDHSTLPGFIASRSTGVRAGSFDQWSVQAICERRGIYQLGDAHIHLQDPFGIFEATVHLRRSTSILVLPRIAPLPPFRISPTGSSGDGPHRRLAFQQSVHASTVREYVTGDTRKQIHWPTTARKDKLHVRIMDSTPEAGWWIILDLDENFMVGSGDESLEEQSVTLAASLASVGLQGRKPVGLAGNCEVVTWLPPQKGEAQRWKIMQALAIARPASQSLTKVLEKAGSSLGSHNSLIVITSNMSLAWLASLVSLMGQGLTPTILLFDAESYGGSGSIQSALGTLQGRGVPCYAIRRGMIKIPNTPAIKTDAWKWKMTPAGEVVPIND
ncbi:MAG: DUF58 domain-containing protein [Chloroflexi bacterium]|nr:DUF58 domain-containing protein [Chloroflexota bacterium]